MTGSVRAVDRYHYALELWLASDQDGSPRARKAWNRLEHAKRELLRWSPTTRESA
jgi:hypothetical protein